MLVRKDNAPHLAHGSLQYQRKRVSRTPLEIYFSSDLLVDIVGLERAGATVASLHHAGRLQSVTFNGRNFRGGTTM
jgi:hypothetical protein